MSVLQLQRAAMAPDLWNRRLRKGEELIGTLSAEIPRIPCLPSQQPLVSPLGANDRLYFVPGGRYLFQVDPPNRSVTLWDLGLPALFRAPGQDTEQPKVVDVIRVFVDGSVDHVERIEIVVHSSGDGSRLRVWVVPELTEKSTSEVWEIDPGGEELPKFHSLGALEVLRAAQFTPLMWNDLSMRGDLAIYHSCIHVIVWNYVEGWCCAWDMRGHAMSDDILFVSRDSLVLVGRQSVYVWDIPHTLASLSRSHVGTPDNMLRVNFLDPMPMARPPPTYRARYPSRYYPMRFEPLCRTMSHWYSDRFLPLYDVLRRRPHEEQWRWLVDVPHKTVLPARDSQPTELKFRCVEKIKFPPFEDHAQSLHRVSHDISCSLRYSLDAAKEDLCLAYSSLPDTTTFGSTSGAETPPFQAEPDLEGENTRGIVRLVLDEGVKTSGSSFTFCSAAGRIAYPVVETDNEQGVASRSSSVRVCDLWAGTELTTLSNVAS